jgi:SAM-dependent methyltransferase
LHLSSLINMTAFRDKYLTESRAQPYRILDLGSTEMGACYRPIFADVSKFAYTGVDLSPGPNVDVVLKDAYNWREIPSGSVDVIISGQVLEHVSFFWITALEAARVLAPGGLMCFIAPSSGPEHRYPVDCWRFYPDGMRSFAQWGRLTCLEATTHWGPHADPGSDLWRDSVLVAQKPRRGLAKAWAVGGLQRAQRWLLTRKLVY